MNKIIARKVLLTCITMLLYFHTNGQSRAHKTPNFDYVVYQHPFQYFYSGFKIGVDFKIEDRLIINAYTKNIFTQYPRYYNLLGSDNQFNVDYLENYLNDASLGVMIKSQFVRPTVAFHGYYCLAFAESGRGWESFFTSLGPTFPRKEHTSAFKYQRFGVGIGRQWAIFGQGILDVNFGLGFNDFRGEIARSYEINPPFNIGDDQAYLFTNVGLGIGKQPKLLPVSKQKLKYGLTLDFNAMLKQSTELGILFNNKGYGLWHVTARYGSLNIHEPSVTIANTFETYSVGVQYRHYPFSGMRKDGAYFGAGVASGHTKATIHDRRVSGITPVKAYKYDPQHLSFTMGFSSFLKDKFLLDGYISNTYTFSPGRSDRSYPHPDEATGIQTVVGLKFGIVRLK